jgi:hypothetical protein
MDWKSGMNGEDTNDCERRSDLRRRHQEFRSAELWGFQAPHVFKENLDTVTLERSLKGARSGKGTVRSAHQ